MSTHHAGTASAAIILVLAALLVGGCGEFGPSKAPPTVPPDQLPCDPPASETADLDASPEDTPAIFTTDGSGLYVTVSGFEHTQAFDPKVGSSAIYVGHPEELPTYNRQSSEVTNLLTEVRAEENQPTELDLPAGRYWLWASNAPDLRLWGCAEGSVTDAVSGGN